MVRWLYQLYSTRDNQTNEITEGQALPNEVADQMPALKALLDKLGLDYFSVRIAKTEPGAFLWEHRDYVELGEDQKLRLHIPLVTSPDANMQIAGAQINMTEGFIWKLDPTTNHAISNVGKDTRIHLILDCYMNDKLKEMLARETLDGSTIRQRPALSREERQALIEKAKSLFEQEGPKKAEEILLKSFHSYDLGNETSYDILTDFYKQLGFTSRQIYWERESITRIAERPKVGAVKKVNLPGDFFQAVHAKDDIPQYKIMSEILKECTGIEGLDQAYIRGSLARGDADVHSDIDLLCVVTPEKFEEFVNAANKIVREKHAAIFPGWTDTIVKDFGGVGFVHLIEHEGKACGFFRYKEHWSLGDCSDNGTGVL